MSYNIDTWKTKKLENLVIPLKFLYEQNKEGLHPSYYSSQPEIVDIETNEVSIKLATGQKIKAILKDKNLHIIELKVYGEGSGIVLEEILKPALKQSTGELEAVCVWEEGDSITQLSVKDGMVIEEGVDL